MKLSVFIIIVDTIATSSTLLTSTFQCQPSEMPCIVTAWVAGSTETLHRTNQTNRTNRP